MSSHHGEVLAERLRPGHDVGPAGVQTLAQPVGASPLGPDDCPRVVDPQADAPPPVPRSALHEGPTLRLEHFLPERF